MRNIIYWMATAMACGCVTVHDPAQPADESLASADEATIQSGYVYIEQLAPNPNWGQNEFVWEAYVPGIEDVAHCSFFWWVESPDGFGTIMFRQTTWIGATRIQYPGDNYVHVDVECNGASYGSASLHVYVNGIMGQSNYPPPPSSSGIPEPTPSSTPPVAEWNDTCKFWTAYDRVQHKYYAYKSAPCFGGAARRELNTNEWDTGF